MAARNYSEEYKTDVLAYLRTNSHSYYKTAKKFKVSTNTIKAWDNYPNNLPEEVRLRIKLNKLQKTKKKSPESINSHPSSLTLENLPDDFRSLELYAIKSALQKGIFLLDYVNDTKEYLEITKALTAIMQLPANIKNEPRISPKQQVEEFLRKKQINH